VLSNPSVHVCLSGPKNQEEMQEALKTLEGPPLDKREMDRIRRIGDHVHKRGLLF
jgi:predicted aldo/keto reductase-like oxidoreductase